MNNEFIDEGFNIMAKNILESLYYFVFVNKEAKIEYINQSYAAFLGKEPKDLLGQHVSDVIPNTRLAEILETKKNELGKHMLINNEATGKILSTICNRILIYRNGDPSDEIVGAIGESIIRDYQDFDLLYDELELLRNQNELYKSYVSEIYSAKGSLDSIIGISETINNLKNVIKKIANSSIAVCIIGETGTGKELVANALHKLSKRASNPFIRINCAAIPKDLLESELFGYEAGAFTGADKNGRMGKFELANHGTILLDEIGEMPLTLQTKLLRVLQEKEIERIGGNKPISLDIRVLCSTNKDLAQSVRDNQFRSDLYYRISTMELYVPPLRDRMEDLIVLCPHFVQKANERNGVKIVEISDEVYSLFESYHWPGNIRELEHIIERAGVLKGYGQLKSADFSFLRERMSIMRRGTSNDIETSINARKNQLEYEAIQTALEINHGNKAATARYLKMDRSALYYKLKKYGLL